MENFTDWEVKNLVRELNEGREQARQLQIHLNAQSSSSYKTREFLLHRILSSYDHALAMLQNHTATRPLPDQPSPLPPSDFPAATAAAGSPAHTDDSDQDNQASRKRKATPRWTEKVKVSLESGIEGQLDDGYGWRKYGQKDILGAKYPRGYYRCTNRHGQGCLATKQVQRSDEDPTVFNITYRREHTCNPLAGPNPPDPNPLPENPHGSPDPFFNIQTSLRVLTQPQTQNLSPTGNPFDNNNNTSNPQTSHDGDNKFLGDYFSVSANVLDNNFGALIPNLMHTSASSESELSPIVAAMTSGTTTAALGTSFPSASSGLDSNFSFGGHGYYHP